MIKNRGLGLQGCIQKPIEFSVDLSIKSGCRIHQLIDFRAYHQRKFYKDLAMIKTANGYTAKPRKIRTVNESKAVLRNRNSFFDTWRDNGKNNI